MKRLLLTTFLAATALLATDFPQTAATTRPDQNATIVSVIRFSDGLEVPGAFARLVRKTDGLTVNLHTSELTPGAYTLWWGIYNFPENCDYDPCGGPPELGFPDDSKPSVGAFWTNATGHVVGQGNEGDVNNFSSRLNVGGPYGDIIVNTASGLLNPEGAQVQLVLRYHGPVVPGLVREQTSLFLGGCPDAGPPCEDKQFILFPQ